MYLPADNCLFSRTSLYPSPYTVVFFNKHACLLEKSSLYVFQKVYTFWRIDNCLSLWVCPYSFMDIPVFLHNHCCIFSNKQWCMDAGVVRPPYLHGCDMGCFFLCIWDARPVRSYVLGEVFMKNGACAGGEGSPARAEEGGQAFEVAAVCVVERGGFAAVDVDDGDHFVAVGGEDGDDDFGA